MLDRSGFAVESQNESGTASSAAPILFVDYKDQIKVSNEPHSTIFTLTYKADAPLAVPVPDQLDFIVDALSVDACNEWYVVRM